MSRGLGKLQQSILDRIDPAGTTSLNQLEWILTAEQDGPSASITAAGDVNFRRAVRRLVEEGYLRMAKQRLTDLDDVIAFYPYKTRDAEVKAMRLQMLPVVKSYLAFRQARKFSPAQNEIHFYQGLSDETRADAERRWQAIEPGLFDAMCCVDAGRREAILDLLVRGRHIFLRKPTRHLVALTRLLERALAATGDFPPIRAMEDLSALASSLFPRRELARLRLKSDLYEIAHLGRDHTQTVKDQFIEYAMRESPQIMRSMRGFKPARSQKAGKVKLLLPIRDEPSPLIHKLVQRDALAPFQFLSVRRSTPTPPEAGLAVGQPV